MKVKQLRDFLNFHGDKNDDLDVRIILAEPSVGPCASVLVTSARFGFDWDRDLILNTEERLTKKGHLQDLYEMSRDLMMFIATKPHKKESYEIRTAKRVLIKSGHVESDFIKYRNLFHKETP